LLGKRREVNDWLLTLRFDSTSFEEVAAMLPHPVVQRADENGQSTRCRCQSEEVEVFRVPSGAVMTLFGDAASNQTLPSWLEMDKMSHFVAHAVKFINEPVAGLYCLDGSKTYAALQGSRMATYEEEPAAGCL
jgi:hypothetical protein